MKNLVLALIFIITSVNTWAQDTPNQAATPQKPLKHGQQAHPHQPKPETNQLPNYSSLVIDWGFDWLRDRPQEMDLKLLGSRFSNIYLYYNIRLGQSHFAISPGIGVGFGRYQFKEKKAKHYYTLVRNQTSRHTAFEYANNIFPTSTAILQSRLNLRYLDFMLEGKFSANLKYPKESFFVALGFKLGMLWHASTAVKYKEDDQTKQQIAVEFFNLNKIRYGLQARLGWGHFSLFYAQILSHLFNKDSGPGNTTTKPYSIGLSIDFF